jgi:phospholipid transport system substrate-binding protein
MKLLSAILFAAVCFTTNDVHAADSAEDALRKAVDDVLAITQNSQGGRGMAKELQPVLEKHVCFESMTRRAIGPGWRQMTPEQQKEATRLFTKLVIRSYSEKFTPGQQPAIDYLKGKSPAPDKAEIPTSVIYKGSRYTVTYRLENRGQWRVTDILAEGVSLVANYRAQFDPLVKKSGPEAVINSLKQSVGSAG